MTRQTRSTIRARCSQLKESKKLNDNIRQLNKTFDLPYKSACVRIFLPIVFFAIISCKLAMLQPLAWPALTLCYVTLADTIAVFMYLCPQKFAHKTQLWYLYVAEISSVVVWIVHSQYQTQDWIVFARLIARAVIFQRYTQRYEKVARQLAKQKDDLRARQKQTGTKFRNTANFKASPHLFKYMSERQVD